MNSFCLLITIAMLFGTASAAFAQSAEPDPSKAGSVIVSDDDDIYRVNATGPQFAIGAKVLFIRVSKGEFEILARGEVEGNQNGQPLISVDRSTITKIPLKGDFAVPIANPWTPEPPDPEKPAIQGVIQEEDAVPDEPGYMQFDYGFFSGDYATRSSNQADAYKNIANYRFPYWHYVWVFEFAWRFGLEVESYGGKVPTYSYVRKSEDTTQDIMRLNLLYRLRPIFNGWLRPSFRLSSLSNSFMTSNKDEAILTTDYSAMGAGVRLASEFKSNVWKPEGRWPITLQQIYVDADYFPSIDAKDITVSRGTSSTGSMGYGWKVGFTSLVYIKRIPFIPRFVLEASYGQTTYDMKFSGKTTSEVGGPYKIPENGTYKETQNYYRISIGVRIDDTIGRFFMPR